MGTEPTTVNPVAQPIDDILNGAVESTVVKAANAAVISQAPALFAIPVVGWILRSMMGFAINVVASFLFKIFTQQVTKLIINIQVYSEESGYNKALAAYKAAQGDPNATAQAKAQLEASFDNLIHYDGSAS